MLYKCTNCSYSSFEIFYEIDESFCPYCNANTVIKIENNERYISMDTYYKKKARRKNQTYKEIVSEINTNPKLKNIYEHMDDYINQLLNKDNKKW